MPLVLSLAPLSASTAATEAAALITALAKPLPASTVYYEERESPLLAEPLRFSGELQRPQPGVLLKSVSDPHVETTRIADGRVSVEREGQGKRSFSLKRAPELVALTASFEAILSGDAALLERTYTITLEAAASDWRLTLTPRDARLARRVTAMRLHGSGASLHCIDLQLDGDELSRMWLGELAQTARNAIAAAERAALCGALAASDAG